MKSDTMVREELGSVYRMASSGMTKQAISLDSLKNSFDKLNLSDGAKSALIGGLGGAGLGLVAHLITPKDKDEDQRKRLLSHVLSGAALGGVAGYGVKKMLDTGSALTKGEEPGWYQRNAPDIGYGDAALLTGLGLGLHTGTRHLRAKALSSGVDKLKNLAPGAELGLQQYMKIAPERLAETGGHLGPDAVDALRRAGERYGESLLPRHERLLAKLHNPVSTWLVNHTGRVGRWAKGSLLARLGYGAHAHQLAADRNLVNALRDVAAGGHAGAALNPANMRKIVSSGTANPRNIITAMRRGGGGSAKGRLYAALLAAGLIGTGFAINAQDK